MVSDFQGLVEICLTDIRLTTVALTTEFADEARQERLPWRRPELKTLNLKETTIRANTGNDGVGAGSGFNYSAS